MKKPTTKKMSIAAQTIRPLQNDQLAQVAGGTITSGTSVISVSTGTSVISRNPSGG